MPGMGKTFTRAEDERLLKVLSYIEQDGMTFSEAGNMVGISRTVARGQVQRVREHTRRHEAKCADQGVPVCACKKPENRDGGMPPRWWKGRA